MCSPRTKIALYKSAVIAQIVRYFFYDIFFFMIMLLLFVLFFLAFSSFFFNARGWLLMRDYYCMHLLYLGFDAGVPQGSSADVILANGGVCSSVINCKTGV